MNESFSAEWKEGRSRNIITAYQERGGEMNLELEKYVGELRILREEFSTLATAYDGQQEKIHQKPPLS